MITLNLFWFPLITILLSTILVVILIINHSSLKKQFILYNLFWLGLSFPFPFFIVFTDLPETADKLIILAWENSKIILACMIITQTCLIIILLLRQYLFGGKSGRATRKNRFYQIGKIFKRYWRLMYYASFVTMMGLTIWGYRFSRKHSKSLGVAEKLTVSPRGKNVIINQ